MPRPSPAACLLALPLLSACSGRSEPGSPADGGGEDDAVAHVREVSASGEAGAWTFAVTVESDETGCEQYADWWEVLTPEGGLVYRRILAHSHPDEQPFTRTGGPVEVAEDRTVLVRAHLHPSGYGGAAMEGSVAQGFSETELDASFAASLAEEEPQPEGCAW